MTRLAAVTGATGFLGRHLVRALAKDGWRIRILARRDPIHPLWADLIPEAVIGGLADDAALGRLCAGADVVIHAAGLTKARSRADFEAVNVDGARRVAERTSARLLLVSSLAAREPQLSDYAFSKRGGELSARDVVGDRLTVVRPPALYGPGDPETLSLFQAAGSSPVLPLFDPAARIAMMHVADAAAQIAAMAGGAAPAGATITLSDRNPAGYSWRQILEAAARAAGGRPRFVRAPSQLISLAAWLARMTPSSAAPMLSPGKAREMRHLDWSVHASEQGDPGALPAAFFDINDGFSATVGGYRAIGVLR